MGFIFKTIAALCIGAFLLCILIPLVSFGVAVGEQQKRDSERLTKAAENFTELPNQKKADCKRMEERASRNPLPSDVCFCIAKNTIAHPIDKDRKKISSYIEEHGTTLTIPKDILLDNFYRGNVSNVIGVIKLKFLAKK